MALTMKDIDLGLPHRAPFLFVREIIARRPGLSAECATVFESDDPMFAEGVVRFMGQALFAVAAESLPKARAAAALRQSQPSRQSLRQQCRGLVGFPLQGPDHRTEAARGHHHLRSRRNRGAELARGEILFFVDADVVLACGALRRLAKTFSEQPALAAVFGSYDATPPATGLVSQYRNLLHHFVHQTGNPDASTFWAGCGAIRQKAFERVGGFDARLFPRPSIEDIELGARLARLGHRVRLEKRLRATHLKRWTLGRVLLADVRDRAARLCSKFEPYPGLPGPS